MCVCTCVLIAVGCESMHVIKYMSVSSLNQVNTHVSLSVINILNIALSLSVCLPHPFLCASIFVPAYLFLSQSACFSEDCVCNRFL